jgi:hypothetical protein
MCDQHTSFSLEVGLSSLQSEAKAYRSVTRKLTFAVATGIFLFEVYAFYRLFKTYGADDFGTWLSLAATLPLLGLYRWVDLSFAPSFNRRLDAVHRASGHNGDNTDAD